VKPFRERNPVPIAIIGILTIGILMFASLNAQALPFFGGTTYKADFTDAGGIKANDDVRVAGVKVGTVKGLELHNGIVRVSFTVKNADLGRDTRADIKIKTLLGQKYIALTPDGPGHLSADTPIPTSRTTTPLDVTTAFIGLSRRVDAIDTTQLAKAFNTLSDTFKNSPGQVKDSLRGLSRLSQTVASRDQQLSQLLQHARGVTGVLAGRDAEVRKLIDDGNSLLQMVSEQRAIIHQLLVDSATLGTQLSGLVQDNRQVIAPALANLQSVLTILQRNQTYLDSTIHLLAPFVRAFDNTLGTGRWFDTFIGNLPPPGNQVGVVDGRLPSRSG
jgi:phospholipid/cholesterol/gamma-HCH transport system substrate-binding protein